MMNRKVEITVVGDAFIDILVPVHEISPRGVSHRKISMMAGGIANTAIWAARLNANAAFVGKVGKDAFGELYRKDIVNENVLPHLSVSNKPTGKCVCLIDGNERTMVVDRGANDDLKRKDVPSDLLEETRYSYFSGYSFASKTLQREIQRVMKKAKSKGNIVIFNAGSYNIVEDNLQIFKKAVEKYVDILVLNELEAGAFANEDNLNNITLSLKEIVPKFVVTLGPNGSIAFDGSEMIRTIVKPIPNIIDTTGAGDAFVGGFLAGAARQKTFRKSILLGHGVAEKAITKIGAR